MNTHTLKTVVVGMALVMATFSSVQAEETKEDSVHSNRQIKEDFHPYVNGSPVTLIKDNMLTQALGGRILNVDVWTGEFVKFDDNIFNTSSDKKSDTIFSTAAGVLMQGEQKDVWKFRVEGQIQRNEYVEHDEFSGYEGHLNSLGSVDFSPALGARVKFDYSNTYDNQRNVEDIYARRKIATGGGLSLRPSPFFGVDLDYTYFAQRRDDEVVKYQEYDEHTLTLRPTYALTPNTAVYMQFDATDITPLKERYNHSSGFDALFGVAWMYKDTAKVIAEAGYKNMSFGNDHKIRDTEDNHGSFIGRLRAEYSFTTDWTAGLDFGYAPAYSADTNNASQSNYVDRFTSSAFLNYSPGGGRFTFSLRPFYISTKPSENDMFTEYGVNAGVSYVVTDWFNVNAGYTVSAVKYEKEDAYTRNMVTLGAALTF